ncbi:MAG: hypothetical protein H7325_10940 [Pedobacter sp.]|nr:hypothetical protein [Pedobacter sp.]
MVVKQYPGDRTIPTNYPDMSKLKPSEAQLIAKSNFAQAVVHAKETINNAEKKSLANARLASRKRTLYHALIAAYMSQHF